jgi:hypothetical protein
MATVSAVVYEGQKKADGTYNVKIRVFDRTLSKSFVIPVRGYSRQAAEVNSRPGKFVDE